MYGQQFYPSKFNLKGPRIAGHISREIAKREASAVKRGSIWAVSLTGLLMGCATLTAPLESRAEKRFDQGLEALAGGDYRLAHERLSWVVRHYGHEKYGHRAILTLAAMEMDPRNPTRRVPIGTDLAATYLRLPDKASWTRPVAQTLYLLGLELGAVEERVERAEREASRLPALPGPSVSARIKTIEQERDRLARRIDVLEKQLSEKDQELQRIRKTIRP